VVDKILDPAAGSDTAAVEYRRKFQRRMTESGAHIRSLAAARAALSDAEAQVGAFRETRIKSLKQLPYALTNRHLVFAHAAYLSAISAYLEAGGGSRGSFLVMDPAGTEVHEKLEKDWRFKPEAEEFRDKLMATRLTLPAGEAAGAGARYTAPEAGFEHRFVPRRPIPDEDFWFENVWRDHVEKKYFRERIKD
jgi:hypothetical protein